ncbi:MAG: hypothetical protein PHC61_10510 [Chitinivibrionales bacterium]|nr:hypothetical protein [Chitinivibrionales bacterium]
MAYSYEELKGKTVAELREIAATSQHEALQGYTQLNKEHLLVALCKAFNIDTRAHHAKTAADKKIALKTRIKDLKKQRNEALAKKDRKMLKRIRRKIHGIKHELRAD